MDVQFDRGIVARMLFYRYGRLFYYFAVKLEVNELNTLGFSDDRV